jgi:hypothetical protein
MPQIDLLSYFSVGFYTAILFLTLVFILYNYLLPQISLMLKIRNRIRTERGGEIITPMKKIYRRRMPINESLNIIKNRKKGPFTIYE